MNTSVMDYQALKNLVKRGEGSSLEFKLKTNHPEKIIRGIVAFANTNGGIMLIGVADDKTIRGLKYADEDEYLLVRAINNYCFPRISYTIDRVQLYDEREVLVIRVPPSPTRPHYIIPDPVNDPDNKKAYVRVADKSVQASREVREILKGRQAERSIRFTYGDKEHKLMQHLVSTAASRLISSRRLRVYPEKSHRVLWSYSYWRTCWKFIPVTSWISTRRGLLASEPVSNSISAV